MEKHPAESQSDSAERISNVFRGNENAQKELNICSDIIKIFIASTGKGKKVPLLIHYLILFCYYFHFKSAQSACIGRTKSRIKKLFIPS